MEDVERRQATGLLFYFILLASCCLHSIGLAATQGKAGRTSVGSLGISVHIPQSVRLLANKSNSAPITNDTTYCLSVIDAHSPSGLNFYQINTLHGWQQNLKASQLQLYNRYGLSKDDVPTCQSAEFVASPHTVDKERTNALVLILIPE